MRLAIIAGSGALPRLLHATHPEALVIVIGGSGATPPAGADVLTASFEKIGALFSDMRGAGVDHVVFAGAMDRPSLNPARFDLKMMSLVPRLMPAMGKGDDTLLRLVIDVFEGEGFTVVGAHALLPDLVAASGPVAGPAPTRTQRADAARAAEIHATLSPLDIGQGVVVCGGLCAGIETVQGTDALLAFVGAHPERLPRGKGGVLLKAPKLGQDLRIDMPTIGSATIDAIARAGLSGCVIRAGAVMIVERDAVSRACDSHKIALWAEPAS